MFLKRFPDNALIKKIKISGPFVSVYVPEEELENFQKKYEKLLSRYSILSIGEGLMHDFAHHTHNKHLSFLTKDSSKAKTEHFHFILPATVNESNLKAFLGFFDDHDLSKEQKQALLQEFQGHSHTTTLETLAEQANSCSYILSALLYKDPYLSTMMPLFTELVNNLEPYLDENGLKDVSSTTMMKVGNNQVGVREAFDSFNALLTHIGILSSFKKIIEQLKKDKKKAIEPETIIQLNELFKSASTAPLPKFGTLPYLFNELTTHLPFVDGDFNNAYAMLKEQLSTLLKTDDLVFTPQIINLSPADISYNQAILFLSKQGNVGQKIMDTMARLQEGKKSFWNPYWMNSGTKLQGIVDTVLKLKDESEDNLKVMMQNPESELYLALNKPRLLPLTFLGEFAVNKSKSIIKVEDEIANSLKY